MLKKNVNLTFFIQRENNYACRAFRFSNDYFPLRATIGCLDRASSVTIVRSLASEKTRVLARQSPVIKELVRSRERALPSKNERARHINGALAMNWKGK